MKLDQLHYFVEAARYQHIGKASRALAISPSAISHSITALEEELGHPLFVRDKRRIFLTSHGKKLADKAKTILSQMASLKSDLSAETVALEGYFRLGATHGLSRDALMPAWVGLQKKHPKLVAEIFTLRSAEVIAKTAEAEFDLGLCFSPQSHPRLNKEIVCWGSLVVAVGKRHPLLKIKEPDGWIKSLSRYPSVAAKAFRGVENCESHPLFSKYHLNPDNRLIFDSYDLAAKYVSLTQAWGLFPDWVIKKQHGITPLVSENFKAPYEICAVWPKSQNLMRPMRELLGLVKKEFCS